MHCLNSLKIAGIAFTLSHVTYGSDLMLLNQSDDSHSQVKSTTLTIHKPEDRHAINKLLDDEMRLTSQQKLAFDVLPTIDRMVAVWTRCCPASAQELHNSTSTRMIAEAWYWSRELGLFKAMENQGWLKLETQQQKLATYERIRNFRPFAIMCGFEKAPMHIADKIRKVTEQLIVCRTNVDISLALRFATMSYFIAKVGYHEVERIKAASLMAKY